MKKINLIGIVIFSIILAGCSKREYFSPKKEDIKSKVAYEEKLPQSIEYITLNGITLKDGTVLTNDGFLNGIKLEKNEKFLGRYGDKIVYSNLNGELKIIDTNGNLVFEKKFPFQIVSASISGNDLALVCADNSFYRISLSSKNIILYEKLEDVYAIDSRIAAPLFIEDIIIYPSLNGRLMIVHKDANRVIQDSFISTEPFFNNIIYLDSINHKIFVATNTNLVLITTSGNKRILEDIKIIFRYQDRIYLFRKDGVIKVFDLDLNEIANNKFKFAIYTNAAISGNSLYIFEKMGYVIKTDLNLQNPEIFKLSDEISKKSFVTKDRFYYDNKSLELK
ncbi:putative beta-barrel assembly machinery complex lipoprotein BamB [Campylobacter blaseri]|uniref:L-seryl-tRNA selenium transferase n=1 Tax=Campylobacter blaseri TaxID=2042961 RepID=A0A2P8R1G1_9BACT|nr:hypothetical protein [Campylobacter blaseri]PSM52318.1 hypothetical protein CQ405_04500 [Campylobacter blaseri]PSM54084.1 hypothetical protein CRN67_04500 [Campylobacter blaseri]QKF85526.1 putative beta-barrel assembly machinery complex lipoprotein BamB [Campylobacter blaseri]